jgi:SAM-dependent methyltransferase
LPSIEYKNFAGLNFEAFRQRALDPALSVHEKAGFPDAYRAGKETAIFRDWLRKLPRFKGAAGTVVEIGCGCGGLPRLLAEFTARRGHALVLIDSEEMLSLLPSYSHVQMRPGRFPDYMPADLLEQVDVLLAYSVMQYVFAEGNLWAFLDRVLALLAPGGQALLGDIPNSAMRKRFLASAQGKEFHRRQALGTELPEVSFNCLDPDQIDDSVVLGMTARARAQGFHAYVLPQPHELPMGNRREDLLICRP